jgi:TrmH family RNA methyltransferase
LERIEKPGNVGAILRTADAAGVDAVLIADARGDLFNPNTIRASGGAVFTIKLATASSAEILPWLREQDIRIFAARVDGAIDYRQASLAPPAAIVLGSEAHGLSDAWQAGDITPIHLPMRGQIDSLNVSVTAGVLFYEAMRTRP